MDQPALDFRPLWDQRSEASPLLSFLVPAYNEKRGIAKVLDTLAGFPESHEVIVVDDGSSDGTRDILQSLKYPDTAVFFHTRNGGKGAAIRTGLSQARGKYTAIQDADLEYTPADYLTLLNTARKQNHRAVFGSRFLRPNPTLYKRFLWGNKTITAWINLISGGTFTDTYTCYKMIETPLFRELNLTAHGFEMEAEICVKLCRRGILPTEVPIHYTPRRVEDGKKINGKDFFRGVWKALLCRFETAPSPDGRP